MLVGAVACGRTGLGDRQAQSAGGPGPDGPSAGPDARSDGVTAVPCAVAVPTDYPTIGQAIAAAPTPGAVCVAPGAYEEDLTLRDGVDLRGDGPGVIVYGSADASAVRERGATLASLRLAGRTYCFPGNPNQTPRPALVYGDGPIKLALRDVNLIVDAQHPAANACADPGPGRVNALASVPMSISITHTGAGTIDLHASGITVGEHPGLSVIHDVKGALLDDRVVVERSGCAAGQCFAFVQVRISSPTGPVAAGSRLHVDVANNAFLNSVLNQMDIGVDLIWADAADAAASAIFVRHNTLVAAPFEANSPITVTAATPAVRIVNNALCGFPAVTSSATGPWVLTANIVGPAPDCQAWFTSLTGSSYVPRPDSPLVDRADPTFATDTDHDGNPRSGPPDVGAFEYLP
jgi:hypothetical protein